MAGGKSSRVPLRLSNDGKEWTLDMNELESAITSRTKLLLLNTPHNPTGKVLSLQELRDIASILERHPHVTAVMDEVYEKLVYDGREHIRLASLPGMWERTLTVSSCGKTFSITGWKVGWVYGHADLVKGVAIANQWVQYSVSTPTQRALATIIDESDKPYEGYSNYYEFVNKAYEKKRNDLAESLVAGRLKPILPQGGFFIMADTSAHSFPDKYRLQPGLSGESPVTRDWAFARWLTEDAGITPIPPSAFYTPERGQLAANLARFAFCKTEASLAEAKKRFIALANR